MKRETTNPIPYTVVPFTLILPSLKLLPSLEEISAARERWETRRAPHPEDAFSTALTWTRDRLANIRQGEP